MYNDAAPSTNEQSQRDSQLSPPTAGENLAAPSPRIPRTLDSGQKNIAESLLECGYTLDTVIGKGHLSTIWAGFYAAGKRERTPHLPFPPAYAYVVPEKMQQQQLQQQNRRRRHRHHHHHHRQQHHQQQDKQQQSVRVALKATTRSSETSLKFLRREMSIWKELEHPHIVRVFETLELPLGCCIAMEASDDGDLLDHIQRLGFLAESEAKRIFQQIIGAVDFLHDRDIAHRDLKCENVLMFADGVSKLGDFGFARRCRDPINGSKVLSETFCGSIPYAAPEVMEGNPYNPKYSDVWSLGVMLYVMLYGCLPLNDNNVLELLKKAKEQDIFFPDEPDVNDAAVELMIGMMEPDVLERKTVRDIQRSSWFVSEEPEAAAIGSSQPPSSIIQRKRKNSFVYDLPGEIEASPPSPPKEEVPPGDTEAADNNGKAIGLTLMSKGGDGSVRPKESAGDHERHVDTAEWVAFEWRRHPSAGSGGSDGSVGGAENSCQSAGVAKTGDNGQAGNGVVGGGNESKGGANDNNNNNSNGVVERADNAASVEA